MKFKYDVNDEKFLEKSKGRCCVPKRYIFVLLGSLGLCNMFATRVCLNVSMVVMVNSTMINHLNSNKVVSECPYPIQRNESETKNITRENYNWDANTQGLILCAIYYGVTLTLLPGAVLCERFGAKWFFGGPVLFSAILTLLTPIAARSGFWLLIILRVLQGFAQGLVFPAINVMIAKWSHILERSRFVSVIYTGMSIGSLVSTIVTGWLCSTNILGGWPLPFYVFGISGIIWFIFWAILVYESPGEHRYISSKELQYLKGSKEMPQKILFTPWKAIFTSVPMWAALNANVSNEFASKIFTTEIPTYLSSVLHFNVLSVGMLSALRYTANAIVSWFASYIADLLRNWNRLSITNIRKLFTAVALFGTAVCLLGVTLSGCHIQLITTLVILSTATTGFFHAGVGTVHIDLSPTFAGSTYAIIDLFGTITGIVGPSIVGAVTLNAATVAQWNCVFYIVAAFQVISALIFLTFGSAELQSWGKVDGDFSSKLEIPKLNSSEDGIILKIQSFSSLPPASTSTVETKG